MILFIIKQNGINWLGWERGVIALARTHTRHIKNTCAVCHMTETFYGVLPHLFQIQFFSALLTIRFFTLMKCFPSFYLLFFIHIVTFGFHLRVTN